MAYLLTALIAALIALLTLTPQMPGPPGFPGVDKLAHSVAFLLLVFPISVTRPRKWRIVGLWAMCYGALIEIVQPHVGRSAEWADLLADGVGVAIGIALALAARRLVWTSGDVMR
ncbi:VanZ family protein [uncultured Roseovarius sp.]|uniref:VanZ family protein n=1 Tax=uncultured Roseovarius sp. TaxID=293344 RepID=UPI0026022190|nr:VanZ family protein [uncultured Roseovarius sp.]